jgi:hypothetical protein
VQCHQDVATMLVREGAEDRLEIVELAQTPRL